MHKSVWHKGFVYFMLWHRDGVGCHGVSFHAHTDAGMLVLGLINAGTLTVTNAYDSVW